MEKIAVLLIHGIGAHLTNPENLPPPDPNEPNLLNREQLVQEIKQKKFKETAITLAKQVVKKSKEILDEHIERTPQGMEGMIEMLQNEYKKIGGTAELVIKIVNWEKILSKKEDILWSKFHQSSLSNKQTRFIITNILGDILAYQPLIDRPSTYHEIHNAVQKELHNLAQEAGENASLCVIAHSLGSVIAYDFFKSLETRRIIAENTKKQISGNPIENGATMKWLYTMGSPLALFMLREHNTQKNTQNITDDALGIPLNVKLWKNIIDTDDIVAYPVSTLNSAFQKSGVQDIYMNVGNMLTRWNAISHTQYWTDPKVITMICQDLMVKK